MASLSLSNSYSSVSVFIFCLFLSLLLSKAAEEEEFSEELLLKPLPDRKVLAHFLFESRTPSTQSYGPHHRLYPKAIDQLVQKFRIREMELSFTQGRWNYERWGGFDPISSANAKPPGVELWAIFDVPQDEIDSTWSNLTHALSGLFCSSINFMESSTAYSSPSWSFLSAPAKFEDLTYSSRLRYGALPREAVCTENLTPWLKLLPCRDKAGLASILDRPSIYGGYYHSQRLHITSAEFGSKAMTMEGTVLQQTLTLVLQPDVQISLNHSGGRLIHPSWSLGSLFGRRVTGPCVLAKSSNVLLELESYLVEELGKLGGEMLTLGNSDGGYESSVFNGVLKLSVVPDEQLKLVKNLDSRNNLQSFSILYKYSVEKYSKLEPLDVGISWKLPVFWRCLEAPFHASRFLMGSGNARGSIAITLRSVSEILQEVPLSNQPDCVMRVVIFQVVPWYIKVYFHTLQIYVDGEPKPVSDVIQKIHVSPSEDRVSPGLMELALAIPCNTESAALTIEFDKGFLHIDEYPPDANQGFDLPSALISFPDLQARYYHVGDETSNGSPLLSKFQENNPVQLYTEVLLVPLATPDFSMPYNVITLTCTVLALYFGSLLNVMRRRIGEEERFLNSKAAVKGGLVTRLFTKISVKIRGKSQVSPSTSSSPSSSSSLSLISGHKLLRVMLVIVIAVLLHYSLND
ncbi:GPI transamidase component GPI16 [Amborella trichopoda]|uniref:GPI transamidase component GPI16 n=1 Tax=Amborella trichopoda TaxID=13333 RepID=UPI0005D32F1C|nr:GPI transamidase component GPI16 [Amborella trichopoda]|eukprot:XP_011621697.1 GPI transamidase component GPI16 [Amborella trichopoda]